MMNRTDNNLVIFHYNVKALWISGWLAGLILFGLSYGSYMVFVLSGGLISPALVLASACFVLGCYFFLLGTVALFSWNLPVAELYDTGVTLYAGVMGSRARLSLNWEELDCAFIAKQVEFTRFSRFRFLGKDIERQSLENVLVLKLSPLLSAQKVEEVKRFCSRGFYDRHFKSNDQSTEIWLVKPPREGLSLFLDMTALHIPIRQVS